MLSLEKRRHCEIFEGLICVREGRIILWVPKAKTTNHSKRVKERLEFYEGKVEMGSRNTCISLQWDGLLCYR
jgi:hypothetical protein